MIAVDCEYLPETALADETPQARPDVTAVYCEIIQIGACKLDGHDEIATLNLTVLPHRFPRVPLWLSQMTGMTDDKRAHGIAFPEALRRLVDFVDGAETWTLNGDWWVLQAVPFEPFRRLKPLLPSAGIRLEQFLECGITEVCSGGLHRVLGLELPDIAGVGVHDAAHDARSLAYSIRALKEQGRLT